MTARKRSNARVRRDVAKTQREECGAAQIEAGPEDGMRGVHARIAVIEQAEAKNQQRGPEDEQNQQRERAVVAEKAFAQLLPADGSREGAPRAPGHAIEQHGDAQAPRDASRKHDRLERFQAEWPGSGAGRRRPEESCSLFQLGRHGDVGFEQPRDGAVLLGAAGRRFEASAEMPGTWPVTSR